MNKEALQANIDRMKAKQLEINAEIADMEAKLKESDNVVLEYDYKCFIILSNSITVGNNSSASIFKHARYRDTKEQAEETLLRELQSNRIEALARKLDPDWVADWSNNSQTKCYIYFDTCLKKYCISTNWTFNYIGIAYMSEQSAETICEYLNTGKYSLDMGD